MHDTNMCVCVCVCVVPAFGPLPFPTTKKLAPNHCELIPERNDEDCPCGLRDFLNLGEVFFLGCLFCASRAMGTQPHVPVEKLRRPPRGLRVADFLNPAWVQRWLVCVPRSRPVTLVMVWSGSSLTSTAVVQGEQALPSSPARLHECTRAFRLALASASFCGGNWLSRERYIQAVAVGIRCHAWWAVHRSNTQTGLYFRRLYHGSSQSCFYDNRRLRGVMPGCLSEAGEAGGGAHI